MEVVARKMYTAPDYCEHFGLQRLPFNDAVNPEFFYRTETHEMAFVRMMMCARHHKALGLVWGRSGTGKTLLAQMLLSALTESEFVPLIVLANPGMSTMGLLQCIAEEMGISAPQGRVNTQAYVDCIHSSLMELYSTGRRAVIVVDEAHFLPSDQLHMVRALTNLETPQEKLCTIILLAEETFTRRLRHRRYNSLRGRIAMTSYLMPMSLSETEQYIKFRLMVGGATEELFEEDAYELIHSHSGGICREVSKLADNALLEAYLRGESMVTREILGRCIQQSI